jgi:PAS domain S-box-containing protein
MEENQIHSQTSFTAKDINKFIVNSISDPIIVLDRNFNYIFVNQGAEKLIRYSKDDLLGNNIFEMHSYLSGSSLENSCHKALKEQEYIFLEQYYPNFDAWTEYHLYPNKEGIVINFKNVSLHKKKEIEALKLIKRNALIIETMREMFLVADEELNVVDVNTSFCEALGYTKKEILGMNICDFDTETSREKAIFNIKKAIQEGVPYIDTKNRKKNGEILDIELTILQLFIDGKLHYASFGRNVTEFKNAQRELSKNNLRFELLGTATMDALWEEEIATQKRWANEIHQNMYGLQKNDPIPGTKAWLNRIDPAYREGVQESREEAISHKKDAWAGEYPFHTENYGWITIYDRTHIIYDQDKNPIRMLGSMTNITELKKAETAIKSEKELSDSIINSLPGIFYLINQEGKFVRWNKNFETISGYSNEELKTIYALDLFSDNEKEIIQRKMLEVFEKGESEIGANILTKAGQKIPYYLNGRLTRKNGEKCLIGMGVDMTEKKKDEKDMKAME